MADEQAVVTNALVDSLLACPKEQRPQWLASHQEHLSLSLLQELKARSDKLLLSAPQLADDISECLCGVARYLPQEPLAMSLACWARGNWCCYHDPDAAVSLYQQALAGYWEAQNPQIIVRLLGNLIFAALQCGRFETANQAYQRSLPFINQLNHADQIYLIPLTLNYGLLLHYQGQFQGALALHEQTCTLAEQHQQFDVVVDAQVNQAQTLAMMGRLAEAETILLRNQQLAIDFTQWLTVARIQMNLGELYVAQGRPAEALRSLQAARTQFDQLGNQMEVGSVLLREANLLAQIGALREARRSYSQAQVQFTELQMLPEIGKALTQNALVNRHYGEYTKAAELLDEADRLWQALDQPVWRTIVQQERVALALAQGNVATALALLQRAPNHQETESLTARHHLLYAKACTCQWQATAQTRWQTEARNAFEQVLTYARQHGDRWLQRQALGGLGMLWQQDSIALGQSFLEQAVAIDEAMRQSLTVEELKASFLHQHHDLLPQLVRLALHQHQPWQALRYIWRAKGGAMLDLLHATQSRLTPLSAEEADLATKIEAVRQELASRRWQVMQNAPPDTPETIAERNDAQIRQLEDQLYELRRSRNHLPGSQPAAALDDLMQFEQRLHGAGLLEYMICEGRLVVVYVDPDPNHAAQCQAFWLCDEDTVLDLVDELHLTFQNVLLQSPAERSSYAEDWLQECRPLLQRCYELLIAPVQELLVTARLLIAPCAALHLFPFAAFWDGEHYLLERFEIEMTPTAALLATPPGTATQAAPLVIAASAEGKLAAIQQEVAAIQATWPDSICQLDDPHSATYLASLEVAPRFLHIATHTIMRDDTPLFTAFQLAGGLLSVEQCYDLRLQGTALVTLCGCRTTSGMDTGGALLAFQSAFFIAGAQRVLSSLWPIDDQATAQWMSHFYAHLAAGRTPAAALRRTQQALLADPTLCHPALWAAFACYRR